MKLFSLATDNLLPLFWQKNKHILHRPTRSVAFRDAELSSCCENQAPHPSHYRLQARGISRTVTPALYKCLTLANFTIQFHLYSSPVLTTEVSGTREK